MLEREESSTQDEWVGLERKKMNESQWNVYRRPISFVLHGALIVRKLIFKTSLPTKEYYSTDRECFPLIQELCRVGAQTISKAKIGSFVWWETLHFQLLEIETFLFGFSGTHDSNPKHSSSTTSVLP